MKYSEQYKRYMMVTKHLYQETLDHINNLEKYKRMSELTYEEWCVMHKKDDKDYFRKLKLEKIRKLK